MKLCSAIVCGIASCASLGILRAGSSNPPGSPVAYISNTSSDDVWVVDMTCQTVRAVIPVGNDPRGIDASPDGSRVYVANRFDNSVTVIDTALNTVVQTIVLGNIADGATTESDDGGPGTIVPGFGNVNVTAIEPYDVVVSPDGTRLYVAMKNGGSENGDGTVVFVDLPSGIVLAEVLLDSGASPEGITISPDGNRLYVAARGQMYVVDVPTESFLTKTGIAQRELAITPDGQFVFANNNMLRTSDNTALPTDVFVGERGVVISPDGTRLFSVNEGNNIRVHSVDRSGQSPVLALITNIVDDTQSQGYGIDLNADGTMGLVSFRGSDTVRLFSTVTLAFVGPVIPMELGSETGDEPKQLVIVELIGSPCTAADLVVTPITGVTLNPQTGLYEQTIRLSNPGNVSAPAARILMTGLATNVTVFNASGTANGTPFVQYDLPVPAGTNVNLVVEFYRATRGTLATPTYTATTTTAAPPSSPAGAMVQVRDRSSELSDGRFFIEFNTISGRRYAIRYSPDSMTWKTAQPVVTAAGTRVQWFDDGPPKTESKPATVGARFYQVVELP